MVRAPQSSPDARLHGLLSNGSPRTMTVRVCVSALIMLAHVCHLAYNHAIVHTPLILNTLSLSLSLSLSLIVWGRAWCSLGRHVG